MYNEDRERIIMTWGAYQQPGMDEVIDTLGARLSVEIHCPVHYPAYNKSMYECMCGVVFPLYLLKMAEMKGWDMITSKHAEERKYTKV